MALLTIIIKQKANDHFGMQGWKTFYCMKNDEGKYTEYDNNIHANLTNTEEAKKLSTVFGDTSWDDCKKLVTLGADECKKYKSNFDPNRWGPTTMGVQWKQNPDKGKICSGVWGKCNWFNCGSECENPLNKLGTCYTYDIVKPSK